MEFLLNFIIGFANQDKDIFLAGNDPVIGHTTEVLHTEESRVTKFLNSPIEDYIGGGGNHSSIRAYKTLKAVGISYYKEITKEKITELMKMHGFGKKSLYCIQMTFESFGAEWPPK